MQTECEVSSFTALQLLSVADCKSLNQQIWSMIALWWSSSPVGHSWNLCIWQGVGGHGSFQGMTSVAGRWRPSVTGLPDYCIRDGGWQSLANYRPLRHSPQTHMQHNAATSGELDNKRDLEQSPDPQSLLTIVDRLT